MSKIQLNIIVSGNETISGIYQNILPVGNK